MAKKFYASNNSLSDEVVKWYASVNGLSKKVVKAYCSVNGLSKQFFGGGANIGKLKMKFQTDFKTDGTTYDLQFADIRQTILYFIAEFVYLNEPNRLYASSLYYTTKDARFFQLLNIIVNNTEAIADHVLNEVTNENEIYITGNFSKSSNVYEIAITFYLGARTLNSRRIDAMSPSTYGKYTLYEGMPRESTSCKLLVLKVKSDTLSLTWTQSTYTRDMIQIGQGTGAYDSTPQYPIMPTIGNVGISFEKNGIENYISYWDFTKSKYDKVDNKILSMNNATLDSAGVHIGANTTIILDPSNMAMPVTIDNTIYEAVLEVEVGSMNLQDITRDNVLINHHYGSSDEYLKYSPTDGQWIAYTKYLSTLKTYTTGITDKDYFSNSTIKWIYDGTNINIYKGNSLVITFPAVVRLSSFSHYYYIGGGGNSNSVANTIIKGIKTYQQEASA